MNTKDKKVKCLEILHTILSGDFTFTDAWKANEDLAKTIIDKAEPGTDYMWAVDYLLEEGVEASWLAFYTGATTD